MRLQRARFRHLRAPTRGLPAGGSTTTTATCRTSLCTSPSLSATASRSPLITSSREHDSSCFQRHTQEVIFHRLEGKRVCFFLGGQSRRRPVLPVPAWLRLFAVRRLVPTRPGYVRFLDSTGLITAASENAELAQDLVRKGRSVPGARNRENCSATITGT